MVKRRLYDLTDEPFAQFIHNAGEVLRAEGIPHNMVGGVASQSYVLDMLTKNYGKSVTELAGTNELRLQDYIRATDDVDIALGINLMEDRERIKLISRLLPQFVFEEISHDGESIVGAAIDRKGASRPTFRVYSEGSGTEEEIIALNLSRRSEGSLRGLDEKWYDYFLEGSTPLVIPYGGSFDLMADVPRLEHVLVTKISQSRAKDLMDQKNLATLARETGRELDFREMGKILLHEHRDNYLTFLKSEYPEQYEALCKKLGVSSCG